MNSSHSILLILLLFLALAACRKNLANAPGDLGQITYLNLSEDLKSQIIHSTLFSHVLIDNSDSIPTYHSQGDSLLNVNTTPYFYVATPLQFPTADNNFVTAEPWIKYSLLNQGPHQLMLTDTGHHPMVQLSVNLSRDIPLSVWFMDSLGVYQGLAAPDIFNSRSDAAGLRVIDAAPDAGTVFFTINKEYADTKGFPDTLQYGAITPFVQRPVALQDTLKLRFYSVRDSINVLAKQTLVIQPGHAYTFALTGYNQQRSYVNPHTGKRVTINADLQVLLFKNN